MSRKGTFGLAKVLIVQIPLNILRALLPKDNNKISQSCMQHSLNPHSMPGTVASSSNKEEEGWGKEREEEKKKKEDEMKRKMIAHTC